MNFFVNKLAGRIPYPGAESESGLDEEQLESQRIAEERSLHNALSLHQQRVHLKKKNCAILHPITPENVEKTEKEMRRLLAAKAAQGRSNSLGTPQELPSLKTLKSVNVRTKDKGTTQKEETKKKTKSNSLPFLDDKTGKDDKSLEVNVGKILDLLDTVSLLAFVEGVIQLLRDDIKAEAKGPSEISTKSDFLNDSEYISKIFNHLITEWLQRISKKLPALPKYSKLYVVCFKEEIAKVAETMQEKQIWKQAVVFFFERNIKSKKEKEFITYQDGLIKEKVTEFLNSTATSQPCFT